MNINKKVTMTKCDAWCIFVNQNQFFDKKKYRTFYCFWFKYSFKGILRRIPLRNKLSELMWTWISDMAKQMYSYVLFHVSVQQVSQTQHKTLYIALNAHQKIGRHMNFIADWIKVYTTPVKFSFNLGLWRGYQTINNLQLFVPAYC